MTEKVVVIGAGVGGLAAAIRLASHGFAVTVLERQATAGGKMAPLEFAGHSYDAGPTVLTMPWVFEELFDVAGTSLVNELKLEKLTTLARHFWSGGAQLDLHADPKASIDAISAFAGLQEARAYQNFTRESQKISLALRDSFLLKQRPTPFSLVRDLPLNRLFTVNPIERLWSAIGRHFKDPRLRQLFARYATYCGSSPFKAPATLMMIAAVEAEGVWRIDGGMMALEKALEKIARRLGVIFHFECAARSLNTASGAVSSVLDSNGQQHHCDRVVLNADSEALTSGLLGETATHALPETQAAEKSLSAVTWCTRASSKGASLSHHNVFFSDDYVQEFKELERGTAADPTVYLCDQGDERKLILVNAPANGKVAHDDINEAMLKRLSRCGLTLHFENATTLRRDARDFSDLYPATAGAIYGKALHGWMAAFKRPQARTRLSNLYLAGGHTHPGPGVPMAALSAKLAVEALMQDRPSTRPYQRMAIAGGISTL